MSKLITIAMTIIIMLITYVSAIGSSSLLSQVWLCAIHSWLGASLSRIPTIKVRVPHCRVCLLILSRLIIHTKPDMEGEGRGSGAQVAAWLQEFSIDQTIGAGLNEDIERIIYLAYDEFEKQEGPRFKLFIEVWQKTCLGQIFSGRESFREMFEFSEELFVRYKNIHLCL